MRAKGEQKSRAQKNKRDRRPLQRRATFEK